MSEKDEKKEIKPKVTEKPQEVVEKPQEESKISVGWLISGVLAIIIIVFIGILASKGNVSLGGKTLSFESYKVVNKDEAQEEVKAYINETVLQNQAEAEISNFVIEKGVYKFTVTIQGEEFDSYLSKDGSLLFPDAYKLKEDEETAEATEDTEVVEDAPQEISKTEKATAYLFTMSYCPYGNQAEDAMIPVAKLLGDKANIEPHYVIYDNYNGGGADYCLDEENKYCSMHGIQELNQNVRELCAYKYEPEKYWAFVDAANKNCTYKDVDECWEEQATTAGVDVDKIKTCQTDEALDLLAAEVELGEKYGITGSPALVINDTKYSGARTAEGYKNGICSGFNTEPEECSQELTSDTAAADGSCE